MTDRIILDLCGGTGSWSRPYREAGYDVRLITLPEHDVRLYIPPGGVHGILAAPPCTHFSRAGAQYWQAKGSDALLEGLSVVDACLRIVWLCEPEWWALENPIGRLKDYIGAPCFKFDPWQFGDPWTKRTWLWGRFTAPKVKVKVKVKVKSAPGWRGDRTTAICRGVRRSMTPPGFARAFFEANP
jgi:hypothetical protein